MVSRRVLLVDPHRQGRQLYRVVLERAGWGVHELTNGLEAIDFVHRERPTAVVMEVALPFLDGLRTVDELRSDPATAEIPILLLTAEKEARGFSVPHRRRYDGMLRKPCDPARLLRELERLTTPAPARRLSGRFAELRARPVAAFG